MSFFINYLFVFDSGMSSMVDLMIVSSYYLWADSPLLHCVLVYVPVWLCALSSSSSQSTSLAVYCLEYILNCESQSFFINYLWIWYVLDDMVSSYYLWADSPLLHCVLVYVPVWLCALSCMFVSCVCGGWGGGGWSEVRQCYVFILSTYFFLFFSLES